MLEVVVRGVDAARVRLHLAVLAREELGLEAVAALIHAHEARVETRRERELRDAPLLQERLPRLWGGRARRVATLAPARTCGKNMRVQPKP